MSDIKEALLAMPEISWRRSGCYLEAFAEVVSSALEGAATEAEAWGTIAAWSDASGDCFGVEIFRGRSAGPLNGSWCAQARDGDGEQLGDVIVGPSRLEALTKIAAWCRENPAK